MTRLSGGRSIASSAGRTGIHIKNSINLHYIKEMYKNGIATRKCPSDVWVNGQQCWMKLVFHVFQDRYTENMYALMYMKNIDAEKRGDGPGAGGQTDPLTNVYNRKIFESEVREFMTSREGQKGTLIILDLDDFKKVNDQFGHLTGDELLKSLVNFEKHLQKPRFDWKAGRRRISGICQGRDR